VNDYQLSRWRGTSSSNRSQVLVANYIYDLPFFKHTSSAFLRTDWVDGRSAVLPVSLPASPWISIAEQMV